MSEYTDWLKTATDRKISSVGGGGDRSETLIEVHVSGMVSFIHSELENNDCTPLTISLSPHEWAKAIMFAINKETESTLLEMLKVMANQPATPSYSPEWQARDEATLRRWATEATADYQLWCTTRG